MSFPPPLVLPPPPPPPQVHPGAGLPGGGCVPDQQGGHTGGAGGQPVGGGKGRGSRNCTEQTSCWKAKAGMGVRVRMCVERWRCLGDCVPSWSIRLLQASGQWSSHTQQCRTSMHHMFLLARFTSGCESSQEGQVMHGWLVLLVGPWQWHSRQAVAQGYLVGQDAVAAGRTVAVARADDTHHDVQGVGRVGAGRGVCRGGR